MIRNFTKLHGAGNDFIIINASQQTAQISGDEICHLCDRRLGIGADGIIFLKYSETDSYNIVMEFYNSDGSRADMCGNGLRCAALYAYKTMGLPKNQKIKTDAGILETEILENNRVKIQIPIKGEFKKAVIDKNELFCGNTGVPHAVLEVNNIKEVNINQTGKFIRNHQIFKPHGTNVNFIQKKDSKNNTFHIRTYERGVEAETLACGTGISAAAFSLYKFNKIKPPIKFITKEEYILEVDFDTNAPVKIVYLTGPAEEIFFGKVIKPSPTKE